MGRWPRWLLVLAAGPMVAQEASLDALLPQIKHHVAEYVVGAPNYTCTETLHRSERPRRVKDFQTIDTIKLEVAVLAGTERFAWPGSREFEDTDLQEIVVGTYGALAKGDFVMHARNIFLRDQATFRAPQMEQDTIRLDYSVPLAKSNFVVGADENKAVVGYNGSVWVDKDTLRLHRIDLDAEGLPQRLHVRSVHSQIDYAPVQLGGAMVLLPRSSEYTLRHSSAVEVRSRIEFSGCREYGSSSSVSFEDAAPAASGAQTSSRMLQAAPGVVLPLRLDAAIDSQTAAVGDVITAVTTKRVQATPDMAIPAGVTVRGRIRKMERHFEPITYFVVGLEFNELVLEGRPVRFFAEMTAIGSVTGMLNRSNLGADPVGKHLRSRMAIAARDIPGVGVFVVWADRVQIAKGHTMTWVTRDRPSAALRP